MARIVVDGNVSDIQRGTETHGGGSTTPGGLGIQVHTDQILVMRIGGQAAQLKAKGMFVVKDSERVIAAGKVKDGVMHIGAARNITGGTQYNPPIAMGWLMVGCLFLIGLPFSVIIIGLPFVGLAIYNIFKVLGWKEDVRLVEQAVRDSRIAK